MAAVGGIVGEPHGKRRCWVRRTASCGLAQAGQAVGGIVLVAERAAAARGNTATPAGGIVAVAHAAVWAGLAGDCVEALVVAVA